MKYNRVVSDKDRLLYFRSKGITKDVHFIIFVLMKHKIESTLTI